MLPERIRSLNVDVAGMHSGELLRHSVYEYRYAATPTERPAVGLLMQPETRPTWQDGDLFPVMDQNLPEGDLFMRLRACFPKQPLSPMHLLALVGVNGIGRLGFRLPDALPPTLAPPMDKAALLGLRFTPKLFDELVSAYLSTGAGIAGMQPKIMVPDRATVPIPSLIIKAAGEAYPGLAANEFLCLSAAQASGIETPEFALSDDGQMLILDRFDLVCDTQGQVHRMGFEDVASLMGLRVRDVLADRKYQGSYERVAELLRLLHLPADSLRRFFEQVAFSVMVRNGDAHLKNFGVLYNHPGDARLAPMFDVVTTAMYRYARYDGGPELEDRTMALRLHSGRHQSRAYPDTATLIEFGRKVCNVAHPKEVLQRVAQGMSDTLAQARQDTRIPARLLNALQPIWADGLLHGRT